MTTPARLALATQIVAFEERAAILEDGGLTRASAEVAAERELGARPIWSGSIMKVLDVGDPITGS